MLTSASVHDSQVAIPLMTMTSARVSYLYDLMDAAYDAAAIHDQSRALGHAPIVDRNFRADHEGKAEWGREVERLKLIHMPDFAAALHELRNVTNANAPSWRRMPARTRAIQADSVRARYQPEIDAIKLSRRQHVAALKERHGEAILREDAALQAREAERELGREILKQQIDRWKKQRRVPTRQAGPQPHAIPS